MSDTGRGSPFAPHTDAETAAMLDAIGVESQEALFDIPEDVRFDGEFGIAPRSEREIRHEIQLHLDRDDDLTAFLGRGHYDHYVPSMVDHLADRSEFLSSYTQYQPEVAQGFLQALFEYQSMLVELTGLEIANCSMYDGASALGEAATLALRARSIDGTRVLIPELLADGRRAVLENYLAGTDATIERYPMADGNADRDALADALDDDCAMVYAENPTVRGTIEEGLSEIGELADEHGALFCLGTDGVALSLLEKPASVGADVVVGDAALGLGASGGLGLGLFATHEDFLRQVPGRLVGVGEDSDENRAYTLTLQTREQHIRRERATSNICTNQAWVALRAAMHAAWLGADGLVGLAEDCVTNARDLADRLDDIDGVEAPAHDRHHFREFTVRTDRSAADMREELEDEGFAVHAIDDQLLQICVTETNAGQIEDLAAAVEVVA
ncbi:aminomethyl-transferring glycine dehydrogenase subunit GcvPA [Halococcus dombrowskii]|uniref:Aminomethyl-transferring glycine dehydrogenase subunit GcvPA n=1 Tax=Halococcus dombrowskii TaxID=179637 RepID=A0AAX3ASJ4_HALDO|nr:aminomethyl-transferring glycine dehydrogenase subunit GcvPA [Halococcus dombrowskii]UOO96215.1 aminomethyl-transferring glycine dehydrogenase subunit GcvPA [Halococcus dombrowskii]